MKYLCLIYDEERKLGAMSKSESDALMGEYFAFTDEIRQSGHYLGGEALQPVQTATTVRSGTARCPPPMAPSPRPRSSWAGSIGSTPGS